jgi:hypothetical protein
MSVAVTALALSSFAAYAVSIVMLLAYGLDARAGSRAANITAVAAFALQRAFPQSIEASALAALACIVAFVLITRRSGAFAGVLAAIPVLVMLLVTVRPFFGESAGADMQAMTVALMCGAGPFVLAYRSTLRLRQKRDHRTAPLP